MYKSFSTSPHTQLSYSLSQLLTLTQYLWVWSFNRTLRKIGAYSFASQRFTSRVMSTVIVHDNLHPIGYIYQDLSNTMFLPKDKNVKREGEDQHDSCIRYKARIKDRPFTEGSRGFHVL